MVNDLSLSVDGGGASATETTITGTLAPATDVPKFVAGVNKILNSDFGIWQRGTSFVPTSASWTYGADRWDVSRETNTSGSTVTRQASGLTNFQYCLRYQRDSGNAFTNYCWMAYRLDSVSSLPLAGRTVTLSFYARAGANYSSAGNDLPMILYAGSGTDQGGYPSAWTGSTQIANSPKTLTTSWRRFTTTGTVPDWATQVGLLIGYAGVGTAGAADYFEITGVQLEAGTTATPFTTATGNPASELAACQRYYWRSTPAASGAILGTGFSKSTTLVSGQMAFPTQMRIVPTAVEWSNVSFFDNVAALSYAASQIVINNSSALMGNIDVTVATMTSARYGVLFASSSAGYLGFSAEL